MLLQPQRHTTRTNEFTVSMESPQSLRRTRSPPADPHLDDSNHHRNNNNTVEPTVVNFSLNEEEERLQYIIHQLNEKQVPPTSHHGLTILITGANRYVLWSLLEGGIALDDTRIARLTSTTFTSLFFQTNDPTLLSIVVSDMRPSNYWSWTIRCIGLLWRVVLKPKPMRRVNRYCTCYRPRMIPIVPSNITTTSSPWNVITRPFRVYGNSMINCVSNWTKRTHRISGSTMVLMSCAVMPRYWYRKIHCHNIPKMDMKLPSKQIFCHPFYWSNPSWIWWTPVDGLYLQRVDCSIGSKSTIWTVFWPIKRQRPTPPQTILTTAATRYGNIFQWLMIVPNSITRQVIRYRNCAWWDCVRNWRDEYHLGGIYPSIVFHRD